jgi:transcriptional regulator with XRE-family HTH domain
MQPDLDRIAGSQFRDLRMKAGVSQEQLAFDAGLDQSLVSKVERRGPAAVSWTNFCKLANSIGYEIELIFRPLREKKPKR